MTRPPIAIHGDEQYIFTVDLPHPKYAMRDLISFIAKNLVDNPDKIILDQEQDGEKTIFKFQVAGSDVGKVIDKKGQNVMALRTLLGAVAAKEGKKAGLDVAD